MCVCCFYSVHEGVINQPRKALESKIDFRGSFMVPHNKKILINVVKPATTSTKGKPASAKSPTVHQKPTLDSKNLKSALVKKKKNVPHVSC